MAKNLAGAKLGIFIFIGSFLLVIGIFLLGNKESLFRETFTVKAYFNNTEGLRTGASVRLSGIDVGSVKSITIVDDTTGRVEVALRLVTDIERFIKTDTKASIETEGLVGNKVVILEIGSSQAAQVKDGGRIQSKDPIGFAAIIEETQGALRYTKLMTKDLSEIIAKVNQGEGTLGRIINDEELYNQATKLTKNAGESLTSITDELERVTGIFKELGRGVESVVSKVDKVVSDIDLLLVGVREGKGILGSMFVDGSRLDSSLNAILTNLIKTTEETKTATERFSENMEALKHNWLFKSYFEKRGYWGSTEEEVELNSSINELNQKAKLLEERLEALKKLEESLGKNK